MSAFYIFSGSTVLQIHLLRCCCCLKTLQQSGRSKGTVNAHAELQLNNTSIDVAESLGVGVS